MVRSACNLRNELSRARSLEAAGAPGELSPCGDGAFTLVELLVSMTILIAILVLGLNLLGQTSGIWQRSVQQVQAFQAARLGFDLMTRDLSQSTLNTQMEYIDGQSSPGPYFAADTKYNNVPVRYARKSDLHFVCAHPGTNMTTGAASSDINVRVPGTYRTGTALFFQAPIGYTAPLAVTGAGVTAEAYNGLDTLLNPIGYYVEFSADTIPPHADSVQNQKYRYRLKQLLIPSERNTIYPVSGSLGYDPTNPARWFTGANLTRPDPNNAQSPISNVNTVADNILVLVVRVMDPTTPDLTGPQHPYVYDSHASERSNPQPLTANQLPPLLQVTMVALDERSVRRLDAGTTEPASLRALLDAPVNGKAKFTDLTQYNADLASLEKGLRDQRIDYRVFATAVPIRESKWTKQ